MVGGLVPRMCSPRYPNVLWSVVTMSKLADMYITFNEIADDVITGRVPSDIFLKGDPDLMCAEDFEMDTWELCELLKRAYLAGMGA